MDVSIDGTIQSDGVPGDEPLAMIQLLIDYGADKSLKNDKGESALNWAEKYNSKNVLEVLRK